MAENGLVGRDETVAWLSTALTEPPRTAVLIGLPGAGKTAVLDVIAATTDKVVLAITGRRSDRDLPYAALTDLLSLAAAEATATELLDLVLTSNGSSSDALRLRLGVLDWLERLAEKQPVLVVVDDAHWIDGSSRSVLSFVANRLADTAVSLLLAARDRAPEGFGNQPHRRLGPLDARQSETVLRRAGITLNSYLRESVLERAAGNPLALHELGRIAQRQGDAPLASLEEIPSSVESVFAADLDGLPDGTRRLLLLAAAGGDDLPTLVRIEPESAVMADLAPAETAGLVTITDRRLRFRHPLARSAVYATATSIERLAVHRALADAFADDPDRRIQHLAAATVVPDETVASALMTAANRARARWAFAEAARLIVQAADLTPDPDTRIARTLDALATVLPTGNLRWLEDIAARLRSQTESAAVRARADHFHAYALAQTFQQDAARVALTNALQALLETGCEEGWGSLTTLGVVVYQSGRGEASLREWYQRYLAEGPPMRGPQDLLGDAAQAWIRAVIDPVARPPELLALVGSEPGNDPSLPAEIVATRAMLLGASAWLLDESAAGRRHLRQSVDLMRRAHIPGQLGQTTVALAHVHFDVGEYDEADSNGRILEDLGEAENIPYIRAIGLEIRARVAAIRGETERARELADEVMGELGTGQMRALVANLKHTYGYLHVNDHDSAGCYEQLRSLFHRNGSPLHSHISYRAFADLVAAAVRAGRIDDVQPVVDAAAKRMHSPGRRQRLMLARTRALLAGDDAEEFHVLATGDAEADQWPFELANARLEYGGWLRRHHRPTDARGYLRAAHDTFVRLGTRAWADLARTELRAAGVTTLEPTSTAWNDLTSQERQVVKLAATGMTNREIGASLYLSPRTVGAHLYNAFPKLGVTSRGQLRDIVEAQPRW